MRPLDTQPGPSFGQGLRPSSEIEGDAGFAHPQREAPPCRQTLESEGGLTSSKDASKVGQVLQRMSLKAEEAPQDALQSSISKIQRGISDIVVASKSSCS